VRVSGGQGLESECLLASMPAHGYAVGDAVATQAVHTRAFLIQCVQLQIVMLWITHQHTLTFQRFRQQIYDGLEQVPRALADVLSGNNAGGKSLVRGE